MRKNLILQIRLLSDLCSGSGDTYNTSVDTDVVYDDLGLPYIPAKRVKGCIRESMLELVDMGICEKNVYERLFGEKDSKTGSSFTMSDAHIEEYDALRIQLQNSSWHPQEVLELFAYTRTQTSVDAETGTAEENHLRSKRVIRSGLTFESRISIEETYVDSFREAAQNVVHIGLNRTRGLGTVQIIVEEQSEVLPLTRYERIPEDSTEKYILPYFICLKSPVLCKSAEGNQAKTQPFFEGNKFLGIIAGNMNKIEFLEMLDRNPVFTTAYISDGTNRAVPVNCSMLKNKNDSFDQDGRMTVYDFIATSRTESSAHEFKTETRDASSDQRTSLGNMYITSDWKLYSVDTEISYHHQRPKDKAIGHATGYDDSSFYQLESIRPGQCFAGYVKADTKSINSIMETVEKLREPRIGYSRNAQYGEVDIRLGNPQKEQTSRVSGELIVCVHSPAILYDDHAMYSTDKRVFITYLENALHVPSDTLKIISTAMSYETIGGYNVTQQCRKPILNAIGRGSIFHLRCDKEISYESHIFIGERTIEGYGELEIIQPIIQDGIVVYEGNNIQGGLALDTVKDSWLIRKLETQRKLKQIRKVARQKALENRVKPDANGGGYTSVSKLIMVYTENESTESERLERMKKEVDSMTDTVRTEGKTREASQIMKKLIEHKEALRSEYGLDFTEDEYYEVFVRTYLNELKLLLRTDKAEGRKENG